MLQELRFICVSAALRRCLRLPARRCRRCTHVRWVTQQLTVIDSVYLSTEHFGARKSSRTSAVDSSLRDYGLALRRGQPYLHIGNGLCDSANRLRDGIHARVQFCLASDPASAVALVLSPD
jgi:hypothetical protein